MYAGAIVVLFLFVIMLLGVDRSESTAETLRIQRPAALVLGVGAARDAARPDRHRAGRPARRRCAGITNAHGGNIEAVAESLFTDFLWPFEITAVLLVIAVVGGVVLARRRTARADEELQELDGGGLVRGWPTLVARSRGLLPHVRGDPLHDRCRRLLVRRNVLVMFMCVELMLNAVNVTFVAFSKALDDISGQAIVFFVLVVAAAEVAVGLAIIVAIFRRRRSGATADDIDLLKG